MVKKNLKFVAMLTGLTIMLGASTTTFAKGFSPTTNACNSSSQCEKVKCDEGCKGVECDQKDCEDSNNSCSAIGNLDAIKAQIKDYSSTNFKCNSIDNIIKNLSGCTTNTPNSDSKWFVSNGNLDMKEIFDKINSSNCEKPSVPKPTETPVAPLYFY